MCELVSKMAILCLWVMMMVVVSCSSGCWEQERIALLHLKANLNYPNGTSLPSWVDEDAADCCQWEGVECNTTTRRVTGLSLNYTRDYSLGDWNFKASLFLSFEELRKLYLPGNSIAGWVENEGFDKLMKLSSLEVLDLWDNSLNNSILSSLTGFSSLKYLNLGLNELKQSTHSDFGRLRGLSNLEVLDLSGNQLNNSIQTFLKLDDLVNLKTLDLSGNHMKIFEPTIQGLEGSSSSSSVLSNLEDLILCGNNLNNSIFPSLKGLSTLKSLDLSYNQLKGSIHVKEFYALCNLEELDVSGNKIESFVNLEGIKSLEKLKVLHLDLQYNEPKGEFIAEGLRNQSNLEELYMGGSSLNKNILETIGELTSLKVLSLRACSIKSMLPTRGWCELKNLQELDLSRNQFEGILPSCLGNLTYLRVFRVSYNELTGNIASSPLSTLTSLEFLSLSNNHFQVPISFRSFANHSKLKVILCDNNMLVAENESNTWSPKFQLNFFALSNVTNENFNAVLPRFLHYQYDLIIIDLSHNNLIGTFPNWLLENNTRLEGLYLSDNCLVGLLKLPSHPNPNILEIDISNNKVGGRIPPNINSIFPNLQLLFMSGNAFDGSLTSLFQDMSALRTLDLSNNLLFGVMPEYFATCCPSLEFIRLSKNNFSGQISHTVFNLTNLRHLFLDGNNFIGSIPNSLFLMSIVSLDISCNHFSGELPRWMGNMINIREIVMSKNNFQGPIPVQFCQLNSLYFLDLSENNLSGSIPSCFNPPNIQFVHLYKNKFQGPLTHAFYNSTLLSTLDLRENYFSGTIPAWISRLSSLSFLLLKDNNFQGSIPSQLCRLNQLTIIDISQNNLSGSLPPCLGNTIPFENSTVSFEPLHYYVQKGNTNIYFSLFVKSTILSQSVNYILSFNHKEKSERVGAKEKVAFTTKRRSYSYEGSILLFMSGIDFSCNQLSGEIPPEFGNLSNIHALNLSHNNLTGSIPTTFSNLRQVESLDLSYNNLNGRIPFQLTELNFLGTFSVAHNNLSGKTPDRKGQIITFEESSYEGNPFLCGPPLHNHCNEIGTPLPMTGASNHQAEEDGFIDMGVFFVSFVASYIMTLFGIFVVLFINPYWRQAWFHLIEVCITVSYYFVVDNFHKLSKFRKM